MSDASGSDHGLAMADVFTVKAVKPKLAAALP